MSRIEKAQVRLRKSYPLNEGYRGLTVRLALGVAIITMLTNVAHATLTITASPNPSVAGNGVSLSVTSPCGPHTVNSVSYYYGTSSTSQPSILIGNGTTFPTYPITWTPPAAGTFYLYATDLNPPANCGPAQGSYILTLVVNAAASSVAISSSSNPSSYSSSITFTATVAPSTATGTVQFLSDGVNLGSAVTVSGGKASVSTTILVAGSHSITAVYSGDPNHSGSTSSALTQTVNKGSTAIAVGSSLNPSMYRSPVTFTATVTPSAATGTVQFESGGVNLGGSVTLSQGQAQYSLSTLPVGSSSISAVYSGDSNWIGSASSTLSETVNKASTTVSLTSSPDPSVYGNSVTLVAAVTPAASTGTVTFLDSGTAIGSGSLSAGSASYSTSALAPGTHSITANYGGDSNDAGSTSSTLSQSVAEIGTGVTLSSSLNPSIYGDSVTFVATVSPSSAPGTVTFMDGSATLGVGTVSGGTASYSTSLLGGGAHSITAKYGGYSIYYTSSTSSTLTETVNASVYSYTIPAGYYAPNGNLVGYVDSVMGSWAFTYDTLNRLVEAADSEPANPYTAYCWGYDAWGNRSIQAGSNAAFAVGSPAPAGQSPCQAKSGASYTSTWTNILSNNHIAGTNQAPGGVGYDAAGNVTNDGVNTYLYDSDGRLCAVQNQTLSGKPMTGYIYNAEGERVAKGLITVMSCDPKVSGFQPGTDYVVGPGGEQLTEMDSNGSGSMVWAHTNIYAAGQLIGTYNANGLHFHLSDRLGTRRVQTNYLGGLELSCTSLPYGDNLSCTGSGHDATEHHFTGKERDSESGLDNFGARYNASSLGRFMNPDPLFASAALFNPQTWNRYAYALNNPLRIVDPTGLWDWGVSAGGSASDEELATQADDKNVSRKQRNSAKKALAFRQKFRDALDAANEAAGSSTLSNDQQSAAQSAVDTYGIENDKNGVTVDFHSGGDPAVTTPNDDGTINVSFRTDLKGNALISNLGHEGVHVEDNKWAHQGFPISHYNTEHAAYLVGSYLGQALGMRVYPSDSGGVPQYQVWNRGWRTADIETLRERGVGNILRDFYPGSENYYLPGVKGLPVNP